jgi:hypothetical protein
MASARPSKFAGGGMLRGTDGVILDVQFSDLLADGSKPKPKAGKPGVKPFHSLFANLTIQEDGQDKVTTQSIFAGGADDFEVAFDGRGVVSAEEGGNKAFGKSSGWYTFMQSLCNPINGEGFDENNLPEEDLDFSAIIGARCRFDQQVNEKVTKKYGQRVSKKDETKKFDRTDLIVTDYYGQVEVEAPKPVAKGVIKTKTTAAPVAKKVAKAVDVAELATEKILGLLAAAKDNSLNKSRLSVRLLTAIPQGATRDAAQAWAEDDDNLAAIEGTSYDADTETLSLA